MVVLAWLCFSLLHGAEANTDDANASSVCIGMYPHDVKLRSLAMGMRRQAQGY
jgi:hypothetical protein